MRLAELLARADQISEADAEKVCPTAGLHPELKKLCSFGVLTDLRVKQLYALHQSITDDLKPYKGKDKSDMPFQEFDTFARLRACRITLQSIIAHEVMQIYQSRQEEKYRKVPGAHIRIIKGWEVLLVRPVSSAAPTGLVLVVGAAPNPQETSKPN